MNAFQRARNGLSRAVARLKTFATSPYGLLKGVFPSTSGEPPVRGTQDVLEAYETMPWLRSVASKVGTSVATTDWRLWSVRNAGRKAVRDHMAQRAVLAARTKRLATLQRAGQLREEPDHLFFGALSRPNPLMNEQALLALTQVCIDLVGDAYWLKSRNALGAVTGFWPIPPHWVAEHPSPARDSFRVSWAGWQRELPMREVVWFHNPAPAQPYGRGSGIAWALLDELEVDEYVAKMAKVLFFNRARPEFVATAEVDPDDMRRIKREWLNEHQGFWRSGKGHFLAGKLDIHEFGQQAIGQQIMYPALRTTQRDIVMQTWGVPPEIFGVLDSSNRATIMAALFHYELLTIQPRVELIRGVLQTQVVEEYDERLVLDYAPRVPEDEEHALAVRKAAPWAWDANDWRRAAGDAPLEGDEGRVRLVPLNSYLTSSLLDDSRRPQSGASADSRLADLEAAAADKAA